MLPVENVTALYILIVCTVVSSSKHKGDVPSPQTLSWTAKAQLSSEGTLAETVQPDLVRYALLTEISWKPWPVLPAIEDRFRTIRERLKSICHCYHSYRVYLK